MFEHPKQPGSARLGFAQIGSSAVHVVVLALLCLRPAPIFVKPAMIAPGEHGSSPLIYLAAPGEQEVLVAKQSKPRPAQIHLPVPVKKEFNAKVNSEKNTAPQNAETVSSTTSGSPESSDLNGFSMEPGMKPAIEISLVDPPVTKADIPRGVEGDVELEITIDQNGNVIGAKILKGLGFGIDQKVLATVLNNWHYRPATKYGVPIPSKYKAYWHFRG